jgi:O-antigen/teichoic acid export membrane protein
MTDTSEHLPGELDLLDSTEAGGRYLRGAGMRLVAWGAGLVVGLGVTPFVTRHLGSVRWGEYLTVTSLIFIVASLTEGGLSNLGVREFSTTGDRERRDYIRSLLGLRIALTFVATISALGFALVTGYPSVLVEGTAILSFGMLLNNLQYTLAVALTARLRLGWLAAMDFMAQAVTAGALITLVLIGAPLLPFFLVPNVAALAILILTVVLVRHDVWLRPGFELQRWRALLSESIIYAAATALGVVYFRVVIVAMNLLSSPVQTGYFGLSFRILDVVAVIPWLLVTSAFPILARAARDDSERLRYALQRLVEGGLTLGSWIAICLIVGAPFAVSVVGGSGYAGSVSALRILGAGLPFTFLVATWGFALLSLKMYRQLIVVNGLAVALAIVLSVALIPGSGADGGAVVTAALEAALASGYAFVLFRAHPELRPTLGTVGRVAVAVAIALAVGTQLPLPSVAAVAVASVVLATGLVALRAIPHELFQAVSSFASRPRGGS